MPLSSDSKRGYTSDPDVLLMLEAQKGDKASFEALLRKYYSRIYNFIYRYSGHRQAAEDLAEETFVCVYKTLAAYNPEVKFRAWLYIIARNLILNMERGKMALSQQNFSEYANSQSGTTVRDPFEDFANRENIRQIQDMIHRLPDHQRTAVILQRFDGFLHDEIASVLDCSVQTVKTLLTGGKKNLKTWMSGSNNFRM